MKSVGGRPTDRAGRRLLDAGGCREEGVRQRPRDGCLLDVDLLEEREQAELRREGPFNPLISFQLIFFISLFH